MAYVSMGSSTVMGGVAGESMQEGRAVVFSASGLHRDLPTVLLASAGDTDVYVVLATPDMLPRPTLPGMFTYQNEFTGWSDLGAGLPDPREATEDYLNYNDQRLRYNVGPSVMSNPTISSGWKVQIHKGGAYTLMSGCYVDSVGIKVQGAKVKVAASGRFTLASNVADSAVATVREYRADGALVIVWL